MKTITKILISMIIAGTAMVTASAQETQGASSSYGINYNNDFKNGDPKAIVAQLPAIKKLYKDTWIGTEKDEERAILELRAHDKVWKDLVLKYKDLLDNLGVEGFDNWEAKLSTSQLEEIKYTLSRMRTMIQRYNL